MELLNQINIGNITLTIYTPETLMSGLSGVFDLRIFEQTKAKPIYRKAFNFDNKKIDAFYVSSKLKTKGVGVWELIMDVLTYGNSLLTVWYGEDILNKILTLKGVTYPDKAGINTIRGSFWCDNPLCNLIHSSDSPNEFIRELSIVDENLLCNGYIEKFLDFPFSTEYHFKNVRHSGITTFYRALIIKLKIEGKINMPCYENLLQVPEDSKECHLYILNLLNELKKCFKDDFSFIIDQYLEGNISYFDSKNTWDIIPSNEWDRLMIKCSVASIKNWDN